MSEFVFYALVALGVPILASVANSLLGGRRRAAWETARVYLVIVALYSAFLLATTLAMPIQVLTTYETQYSGDWSITVASLRRIPHDLDEDYEVDFRLGNRSTKPLRGPKDMVVYLVDEKGTRYNAEPEPSMPPFDVEVSPGKGITTTRKFVLPTNLNRIELVITREGFRIGWFLVGRTPFDGHTVIQLQ